MNFRMRAAPISTTAIGHTSWSCSANDSGQPAAKGTTQSLASGPSRPPTLYRTSFIRRSLSRELRCPGRPGGTAAVWAERSLPVASRWARMSSRAVASSPAAMASRTGRCSAATAGRERAAVVVPGPMRRVLSRRSRTTAAAWLLPAAVRIVSWKVWSWVQKEGSSDAAAAFFMAVIVCQEPRRHRRVTAGGDPGGGGWFQGDADGEDFDDLSGGGHGDAEAPVALEADQAGRLQLQQSVAYRRAGDAQRLGQLVHGVQLARTQIAAAHHLLHFLHDLVGERTAGCRSVPRCVGGRAWWPSTGDTSRRSGTRDVTCDSASTRAGTEHGPLPRVLHRPQPRLADGRGPDAVRCPAPAALLSPPACSPARSV